VTWQSFLANLTYDTNGVSVSSRPEQGCIGGDRFVSKDDMLVVTQTCSCIPMFTNACLRDTVISKSSRSNIVFTDDLSSRVITKVE